MANKFNLTQAVVKSLDTEFKYSGILTATATNVNKYIGKEDQAFVKNGGSFDIKMKVRMRNTGVEGTIDRSFDAQGIFYDTRSFALQDWAKAHAEVELDTIATDLDSIKDDIIRPAKRAIITDKEAYHQKVFLEIGNTILADAAGADIDDAAAVRDRIDELGGEMEDVYFVAPSAIHSSIVNNTSNFFNPTKAISMGWYKGVYDEGKNMAWVRSNLTPVHTNGTATSGAFANGLTPLGEVSVTSIENATTVVLEGITTDGTITKGSVIEFAGVEAVNPLTYNSIGSRAQFAVKETVTSAAGTVTVTLYEKLNAGTDADTASIQNISALPADGDVVYLVGEVSARYKVACAYTKDAFMVGFCDFAKPDAGKFSKFNGDGEIGAVKGMSVQFYDNDNYTNTFRNDSLSGIAGLRREKACRLMQRIA